MLGTVSYSFFLEAALKTTALLAAAGLAVFLLRRRSAALRHLIWNAAFGSVLLLPFLSLALPALRVPAVSVLSTAFVFQTDAHGPAHQAAHQAVRYALPAPELKSRLSVDWAMILMIGWAAGAAISFAQMLIALAAVETLRRRAKPFAMPGFASMTKLLGIKDDVNLLEIAEGRMPITCGLFRPTIFLPSDAAQWSAERRRVVALHELAHVRRKDPATHLLARTVLALHWWNPAVWSAWREFLNERERAADDLVLSLGSSASGYASHLLDIACSLQLSPAFGSAAVAMARRSQLESRLSAILDPRRDRKAPQRASTLAASLAAILILSPVAALHAKSDTAQTMVASPASVGPAAFLAKQGDEAREQGKWDQAKSLYGKALAMLPGGPEAATVLIHLGTVELAAKDFEPAITDFERAQSSDSGKTGEARMWRAIARERQNNLDAAAALYQTALAAQDPNSVAAVIVMKLYAGLLQQQGRVDEANTMQHEASRTLAAQAAQPASTSQSPSSDLYKIGGDVSAPVLFSKVEPEYSADARIAKYQGTVLLSVEIGADGVARNIQVRRPLGLGLDQKATEAIGQWRFKPATKDGRPVKVSANIEVNFRLL